MAHITPSLALRAAIKSTVTNQKAAITKTQSVTNGLPTAFLQTTSALPSMTRLFYPPANCFTNVWDGPYLTAVNWIMFPGWEPSCYPSGINPTNAAYVSPGLCPFGYQENEMTLLMAGTTTQTFATCCPGYVDPVIRQLET